MEKIKTILENQFSDFKTSDGNTIFYASSIWSVDKNFTLDLNRLKKNEIYRDKIKATFAYCAMNYSASYVRKMYFSLLHYEKEVTTDSITFSLGEVRSYFSKPDFDNYTHLETIKYFLKKFDFIFPDVLSEKTIEFIDNVKIKKPDQMKSVKTHDYKNGPFNNQQMNEIIKISAICYENEELSLLDYMILTLLAYSGRRPIQMVQLRVKDLISFNERYFVNFPRVKQRRKHRTEFSKVEIPESLYIHLVFLSQQTSKIIMEMLNVSLKEEQIKNLPLFINITPFRLGGFNMTNYLNEDHCMVSKHIGNRLISVFIKLSKRSKVNFGSINARRFRYTLGTKAAERGFSSSAIAKALDHTTTRSVMAYVHNSVNNGVKLNKEMNSSMLSLAGLFTKEDIMNDELTKIALLLKRYLSNENSHSRSHEMDEIIFRFMNDI
ncbi:site-specific integrase [Pantoea agglomerans]|uniref:site-specific integrase n=1 Tax=Enterobacter agglomerans TaxID=549 RepID=UPI000404AAE3|nr:site-specific integrase [Pantoea agglomerans]